jgi:predicted RNA-binding protein Jag
MSEAHEFIGKDRAEAVAKATAYFGAPESELAISEADATKVSGLGTRLAIVAYLRSAGAPSRRPSEPRGDRGDRGDRGPREARGDRGDRGGRGERGGRGDRERGGRDRERGGRDRDRGDRGDRGGRGRDRDRGGFEEEAPRAAREAAPAPAGPSKGTASGPLGEIGQFVCGLIERMEMGPFEITESGEAEGLIALQIRGAAAAGLTSGDGRAVDAVQLLANQASLRIGGDDAKRVVIEVEGGTDQRSAFLEKIADRAAQRARETGRPVALEAMSPKDRRVVHVALREVDGIATMSVGDGRYRQVVVVPENAPEYEEAKRYESHRD